MRGDCLVAIVRHGVEMFEFWLNALRRSRMGKRTHDALNLMFANKFDDITVDHIRSVRRASMLAFGVSHRLFEPAVMMRRTDQAEITRQGFDPQKLMALIETIRAPDFATDIVEAALSGTVTLPSPYSDNAATCQESFEVVVGLNCLRFRDGENSFFLMQRVSSADGLYFPLENAAVPLYYFDQIQIDRLNRLLVNQFKSNVAYARGAEANAFGGIIASHSRPAHNYYEIWPDLMALMTSGAAAQVPCIIQRDGHDYLDLARLFPDAECHVLTTAEIRSRSRDRREWCMHLGTSRQLRPAGFSYAEADAYLIDKSAAFPKEHATKLVAHMSDCSPIVWVGIEGQKRSWLEQVDGLAALITHLAEKYSHLGIVIDGWTLPHSRVNGRSGRVEEDRRIVEKLRDRLPAEVPTVSLVGQTGMTKIAIGQRVDFFVSNFSSGSLYVSRVLGKPGFCHLSNALVEHSLHANNQIHPNRQVHLLHREFVKDIGVVSNKVPAPDANDTFRLAELGAVSYSMAPDVFVEFIDARLDGVLGATGVDDRPRLFIEPPFTLPPKLRRFIQGSNFGNWVPVFPAQDFPNSVGDLSRVAPDHLRRQMIYGAFPFGGHNDLGVACDYLVWLSDPLQRVRRHLEHLHRINQSRGRPSSLKAILDAPPIALDNQFTRLISGENPPNGCCNDAMLDRAIRNLEQHFVFIGFTQDLAGSYDRLCRAMHWDRGRFPDADAADDLTVREDTTSGLSINHLVQFDHQLVAAAQDLVMKNPKHNVL